MTRPRRISPLVAALAPLSFALGACTMVGSSEISAPAPAEPPGGEPRTASPSSESETATPEGATGDPVAARVVEIALESIGTPYAWGGTDANGFDCSGLIRYAYGRVGIELPRRSAAQVDTGRPVEPSRASLNPGDVLGFSEDRGGRTSHVGLYIGGGEFIHSSSRGVRISTLESVYWRDRLVVARRLVD